MAEWRHVERLGRGELCAVPVEARGYDHRIPCACTTPTPDPASPCGTIRFGLPCGFRAADHTPTGHPHQPTRCTCGHPLEATR